MDVILQDIKVAITLRCHKPFNTGSENQEQNSLEFKAHHRVLDKKKKKYCTHPLRCNKGNISPLSNVLLDSKEIIRLLRLKHRVSAPTAPH